jgi:WS/DGAT/MGAT family acyltransferase
VRLAAPTEREGLLELATHLVTQPMDRTHPLWRIWLVSGLAGGRIAVVVALHHVLADGVAAFHMINSLLGAPDEPSSAADLAWSPRPAPRWRDVVADRARSTLAAWRRIGARKAGPDGRCVRDSVAAFWTGLARAWRAPRTSLNSRVRAGRRLATVDLTVADAREVAHVHGATINDVVLTLAAGGVRALLASRGERVDRLQVHASVAVSLRKPGSTVDIGNQTGGIVVRLPLGEADPRRRLPIVAEESRDAKCHQLRTGGNRLLVCAARLGLLRVFSHRQHMVNFVESNVAGPPTTIRLLGAPVLDIVPIGSLVGNVGLSFLAVSYAARLTIAVQGDAHRFPDLQRITDAMTAEWAVLTSF